MANEIIGHGNCPRIRPISDYASAKHHYERVKPIRGRAKETKPLGDNRKYTWYQIKRNTYANQAENTEYHTYACELYQTDCVEFYPNGDVTLRTGGWSTFTTGSMINFVLWHKGRIVSESGKWYFINKRGDAYRFEGRELKLTHEGDVLVTKDAPVQEYKRFVSRKGMNKIRKQFNELYEYGKNMLAIEPTFDRLELENSKLGLKSNNLIPQYNWIAPNVAENRTAVFDLAQKQAESGDLELLYDLARYVATSAGRYNYRLSKFVCYPHEYVRMLDEMVKYHFRDEVFNSEPIELGTIFNDKNKKYFK